MRKIIIGKHQNEEIDGLFPEYPYVLHCINSKGMIAPWHWHEELEFCFVRRGTLRVTTTNKEYLFHQGEAFFVNSDILCTMEGTDEGENTLMDSHLFHPVFLSGHFKSVYETKYLDPVLKNRKLELLEIRGNNENQKEMLALLKRAALLQVKSDAEFQTRNVFSEIWLLLLEELKEWEADTTPVKTLNQERVQTMMAFIHANYGEKITMEDIASSAAIGKRECLRCFQSCIHKTPFEYLMEYRIEAAGRLLKTTNESVAVIALETGFSGEAYFCKVFKRIKGKTPGKWRREKDYNR